METWRAGGDDFPRPSAEEDDKQSGGSPPLVSISYATRVQFL